MTGNLQPISPFSPFTNNGSTESTYKQIDTITSTSRPENSELLLFYSLLTIEGLLPFHCEASEIPLSPRLASLQASVRNAGPFKKN